MPGPLLHGTTILSVRHRDGCALAGDGQVTLGRTVVKGGARKVRRLAGGKVLAGFAGSTSDALALFTRFEAKLEEYHGNLERAAVGIGLSCRLCDRQACRSRAFPPLEHRLALDPALTSDSPYRFEAKPPRPGG